MALKGVGFAVVAAVGSVCLIKRKHVCSGLDTGVANVVRYRHDKLNELGTHFLGREKSGKRNTVRRHGTTSKILIDHVVAFQQQPPGRRRPPRRGTPREDEGDL